MTQETRELLERARKLPCAERARLAHELLLGLDEEDRASAKDPAAIEAAWREELARRHARALGGEPSLDWRESLAKIRDGLGA